MQYEDLNYSLTKSHESYRELPICEEELDDDEDSNLNFALNDKKLKDLKLEDREIYLRINCKRKLQLEVIGYWFDIVERQSNINCG